MLLIFLYSAIVELFHLPVAVTNVHEILLYPEYFLTLLGTAKLLGVIAFLIPNTPRLKEWVYAGFTFDVIAALWSEIVNANTIGIIKAPAVLILIFISYYLYHRRQAALLHKSSNTIAS
jgi:uncharacterized membrane protein YphA (DoxX/SURF4 family)